MLDHVSHVASDWGQIAAAGGYLFGFIGSGAGIWANFRTRKHKIAKMHAEDRAVLWHDRSENVWHSITHGSKNEGDSHRSC